MRKPKSPRIIQRVFAIDLASGEAGVTVLMRGCVKALRRFQYLRLILVGDEAGISAILARTASRLRSRVRIIHTGEIIAMTDSAAEASRKKNRASVVLAAEAVARGEAFGFFSAGNTGAAISAATLQIGLLPGVTRAVLATVLPSASGPMLLVDSGAGIDLSPVRYLAMARLAESYMKFVFGLGRCRTCLLNIGEEPNKGTRVLKRAYTLLEKHLPSFGGNIEPSDIFSGEADVILCDGFVGNIFIKLCEGVGKHIQRLVKGPRRRFFSGSRIREHSAPAENAAHRMILRNLKKFTDSERYGGSPLLGVKGIVLIGHGQARENAIYNAIAGALLLHDAKLIEEMKNYFTDTPQHEKA
ncbi:MAG: phosphate acyltransferase [Spirochaetota bacterium]|jgi:glycerol-3-phosphate acyltransferase PlsX|nr:phosphate acyltransferase [Spirochaetota bacterium]